MHPAAAAAAQQEGSFLAKATFGLGYHQYSLLPLLGFHYTLPRSAGRCRCYITLLHCLYVGAIWPNTTIVASLAWHSSACSTVCILYYTASRSRMVSYFDLADCAELCVGLRRINGPNFFIDIPTLCGRCRDLIITTASAKATVHCALMYDNCCHYLYLFM